jgi:hypothetical protein
MNKRLFKWVVKWGLMAGTMFMAGGPVWASGSTGSPTLLASTSAETQDAIAVSMPYSGSASSSGDSGVGAGVSQILSSSDMSSGFFSSEHYFVDYFGTYHGSDLSQLGKPYAADQNGKPTNQAMYFDNEMSAMYLFTPTIGIGLDFEFSYTPVLGQDITMEYIGFKLMDRKVIFKNGFTLYSNLIFQLPTTDYDHNRGVFAGIKTEPYVRYVVPHSHFTLGAWTEFKDYAGAVDGKMYKAYVEPYINYSLSHNFSLNLSYEFEADHYASTSGMSIYESDFQPGFAVNLTRTIILNPYLQFFTTNKLTMDSTAVGATITARLL